MQPLTKKISLLHELTYASLGALVAGASAFAGTATFATANDTKALAAAGFAAGLTALTTFTNSLRTWLNQNN